MNSTELISWLYFDVTYLKLEIQIYEVEAVYIK